MYLLTGINQLLSVRFRTSEASRDFGSMAGMSATYEDTSVIIACFNEEQTIEKCIRAVAENVPGAEILVAVGGVDRTLMIAEEVSKELSNVVAFRNVNDRGKGHAIKVSVARARGRFMAQFDADLQFFAEDLPALLAPVREGWADVVAGSRFLDGRKHEAYKAIYYRDAGNKLLGAFVSALAGQRLTDVTAGMKAWTREAIEQIAFRDDRYSYEAELLVRAAREKLRIQEVPVAYASRAHGNSMHRNNLHLARAGFVILCKSFAARFD